MKNEIEEQSKFIAYIKSTILFIASNLGTKIVNLIFGTLLLRYITKSSYSIAKVELEFLLILIQFIPLATMKTTFQKICFDLDPSLEKAKFNKMLKISLKMNYFMIILIVPLYFLFTLSSNKNEIQVHLIIFALCSILEVFVEPVICKLTLKMDFNRKIIAVTILNYTRIFVNLIAAVNNLDLWSFTLGRISSTLLYSFYLLSICKSLDINIKDLFFIGEKVELDNEIKSSYNQILFDNFFKMILTHFEKFVLKFFLNLNEDEKAEYHFVNENFSIIVRYLYLPIEENFYTVVNKLKISDLSKPFALLTIILRFFIIFSTLQILYFNTLGIELLTAVYTSKWVTTNSILILKTYSIYVGILSINGVIESYGTAIINLRSLNSFKYVSIFKSFLMLILNFLFFTLGYKSLSLVYTGILIKVIGISINLYLIQLNVITLYNKSVMKFKTLFITIVCCLNLWYTKLIIIGTIGVIGFISVCIFVFLMNCTLIYFIEKSTVQEILRLYILKSKTN